MNTIPKQPEVKRFNENPSEPITQTNPEVFVATDLQAGIIGVTTHEHLKQANKPLEQVLREICKGAEDLAKQIFPEYQKNWFPCGSADVVLKWNDPKHREIIKLFQKQATEKRQSDYWVGWFGKLFKTSSQGWWWLPSIPSSQSMRYEEKVAQYVRDQLIYSNIKVDVHTYID